MPNRIIPDYVDPPFDPPDNPEPMRGRAHGAHCAAIFDERNALVVENEALRLRAEKAEARLRETWIGAS